MPASSIAGDSHASIGSSWFDSYPIRVLAAVATFTIAGVCQARQLSALDDSNIWWHLRTGAWILQNHAIPRSGLFSQSASTAWVDASWGFDVFAGMVYRALSLTAIPVMLLIMQLMIAVALFGLTYKASRSFWIAIALACAGQYAIYPVQPSPSLFSIAFLAIQLHLLLSYQHNGNAKTLFWLPVLFMVWVNVDRQFYYGFLVLTLFCGCLVAQELCRRSGLSWVDTDSRSVNLVVVGAVAAASLICTFLSPYGYHLHGAIWQSATDSAADRYFRELHSMRFRQPQDYVLMLLAMAAFFALGRRRSRDLFLISLLAVSSVISFRLQRDNWLVVVVALAVTANACQKRTQIADSVPLQRSRFKAILISGALALVVLGVTAIRIPGNAQLVSRISTTFPVAAADYIRQYHFPPPLFQPYAWGGFLTWYLPDYPVFIDSRPDLYGAAFNTEYFKVMQAQIPLDTYSGFAQARTILLESNSPMVLALASLPGFRIAYADHLAVVILRNPE